MIVVREISDNTLPPCVASIGFFDGVHLGHRYLIEQVKAEAAKKGMASALVTFPVHPRAVMHAQYQPELLTTFEEKIQLLSETGIDYCIVLDFTPAIACLSAKEFMEIILKKQFNVQGLLIGHDHRFGHNRSESFDDYCHFGKKLGIQIIRAHAHAVNNTTISSSVIRRLLQSSEISPANSYLGYDYFLEGTVTGGHKIGRTLGFPTANIQINHANKLVPGDGVYAVRVIVGEIQYAGMLNIGHRPTIDNGKERTIEVHILRFQSDIYHAAIRISFVRFIRPEMKFSGKEALQQQLVKDATLVESALL